MNNNVTVLKDLDENILINKQSKCIALLIDWNQYKKKISIFLLNTMLKNKIKIPIIVPADYNSANDLIKYFDSHMFEIARSIKDESSWSNIRFRLRGLGDMIQRTYLNKVILDTIRENLKEGECLKIFTNECWIPWEFVFDSSDGQFWGEKYILVRDIIEGAINPSAKKPDKYKKNLTKIIHAIGNDTKCSSKLINMFNGICNEKLIDYNNPAHFQYYSVSDIKESIESNVDIIHFSCHARIDEHGNRYLQLGPKNIDHNLYYFMLETLDFRGKILFINSCSSLLPQQEGFGPLKDLTTFGWLVSQSGYGALIGSLSPILSTSAIEFSKLFYSKFLCEGLSIGQSLYESKKQLKTNNSPLGLLYGFFGNPSLDKQIRRRK